jgi:hypothetical protein
MQEEFSDSTTPGTDGFSRRKKKQATDGICRRKKIHPFHRQIPPDYLN